MSVNMEDLKIAFELLGFGWGGVFVVLFIIYLASKLLTKLFQLKIKEVIAVSSVYTMKRIWLQKIKSLSSLARINGKSRIANDRST